jgi:DamX protein
MTDSPDQDETDHDEGKAPAFAGYLHSESPRRPAEADPTESLRRPPPPPGDPGEPGDAGRPRGDMRDMEKSLVERIADVDDDRRRSAVQLRKALETHRDEIRAQRRRDHGAMLALAGIGIILLASVLLLFAQLFQARNHYDARLTAMQDSIDALPAAPANAPAGPDLSALDTRLTRVEEGLQARADDVPDGEQVDELADAIEAIGDRLTAVEGTARDAALAASASAGTSADADTSASTGAAVDTANLEARLAALLDDRLASLEARIDELRNRMSAPAGATAGGGADDTPPRGTEVIRTDRDMIVLQLAGLPNRAAIDRFIARHALPEQIYVKVDTLRGRSWYGIIHSLHPDMDAAEAAHDALPGDLARLDTWLRELPAGTRLEVVDGRRP